jgi:hypothetical protein
MKSYRVTTLATITCDTYAMNEDDARVNASHLFTDFLEMQQIDFVEVKSDMQKLAVIEI